MILADDDWFCCVFERKSPSMSFKISRWPTNSPTSRGFRHQYLGAGWLPCHHRIQKLWMIACWVRPSIDVSSAINSDRNSSSFGSFTDTPRVPATGSSGSVGVLLCPAQATAQAEQSVRPLQPFESLQPSLRDRKIGYSNWELHWASLAAIQMILNE